MSQKPSDHYSKPNPEGKNNYARVSAVTFELLTLNLGIIWGGYYLNEKIGSEIPWMMIVSILLSVAASIYYLIKKFVS